MNNQYSNEKKTIHIEPGKTAAKPNNTPRNIFIAVLVLAAIAVGYLLLNNKSASGKPGNTDSTDVATNDSTKVSLPVNPDSATGTTGFSEYEGEEGEAYSEQFVIADNASAKGAPGASTPKLKFGDKVWVDNAASSGTQSKVYFSMPQSNKPMPQAYYVPNNILTYEGRFDEFKKYFSLAPFKKLDVRTKSLILDNNYSSRRYELTQNAERSKSAICYGDFDNDKIQDVAVVMDNNENQYSRLLVICTNAATKEPYLAYAENFSDKMRINSFKKGAKVFMNTAELVPAAADGMILNADDAKIAILYDKQNQKFRTYSQEEYVTEVEAVEE